MRVPAPSPPYVGPPNNHGPATNRPIKRVVIHSTVSDCVPGGARTIARYFMMTDRDASAHYIVDPAEIIQGLYDSFVGYAAPPNEGSIHIEMCDIPGPIPQAPMRKKMRTYWRWNRPNQKLMLDKTAYLTARICLHEGIPLKFLSVAALKNGEKGITTHDNVSQAFNQSTHWDPGFWPRYKFMRLVRKHAKILREKYDA